MSLTMGSGPFARPSRGAHALNFDLADAAPAHVLFLSPLAKRIRGLAGEKTVVDTRHARQMHETGMLPVFYFPRSDVRLDLLEPTEHTTHCPFKGDAAYWTLRAGERTEENVAWGYPEPLDAAPAGLADLVAFDFARLDAWYEEDEEILGHPRDPFHRVDTRRSAAHVVVRAGEEVIADSTRPVGLFETGLPPRWYLPAADVRQDLLVGSDTVTVCPYKGIAAYRTLRLDGREIEDAAFTYPEPLGEALQVAGHLCFLGDGLEVTVDG